MGFLALAIANPAGAKLFTIDYNNNEVNEIDGSDDLAFSFTGTTGSGAGGSSLVSGTIRAVDLTGYSLAALEADVDTYVDFGAPGPVLDFGDMDILIFDLVLDAGSALIDEIGVGVSTDPLSSNPDGAGYFDPCTTGTEPGCRDAQTGEIPDGPTDIFLSPGNIFFPGAALFEYDKLGLSAGNLEGGEITVRLFVAWQDTGPQSPLSKVDQVAKFMLSSGTNQDFFVDIVPEPGTALLLGTGMTMLAMARRRSRES